jgi:hypothetical protein
MNVNNKEGMFCGFVWFVIPKIIINIKKRAITKKRILADADK